MNKEDDNYSEFGKGLTYCLGLFLAHAERHNGIGGLQTDQDKQLRELTACYWFNAAADHLFDMVIPDLFPNKLQKRLHAFRDKCLELRYEKTTDEQITWGIREAKDLLREIDEAIGINTIKGGWE